MHAITGVAPITVASARIPILAMYLIVDQLKST